MLSIQLQDAKRDLTGAKLPSGGLFSDLPKKTDQPKTGNRKHLDSSCIAMAGRFHAYFIMV